MSFEKLIVNPLQNVWLLSLHCDYILPCWEVSVKAENQHTHISALLTFNRLHSMHYAESDIRFNCGFDVPLRINQSFKCKQGIQIAWPSSSAYGALEVFRGGLGQSFMEVAGCFFTPTSLLYAALYDSSPSIDVHLWDFLTLWKQSENGACDHLIK